MEFQELIEPSIPSWVSPIVSPKKKTGTYRVCVDFRKLNRQATLDSYPMSDLNDLLKQVSDRRSSIHWISKHRQVEFEEISRPKTAFTTPPGLCQLTITPFDLKNAPGTFVHLSLIHI